MKVDENTPPKCVMVGKDHIAFRPVQSTIGGKSLAAMGIEAGSTVIPTTQDTPAGASGVKDLDFLSYAKPRPIPEQDIAHGYAKCAEVYGTEQVVFPMSCLLAIAKRYEDDDRGFKHNGK
ncbi:hypothetical protein Tco_0320622 [Tanacetum coccineum]